MQIFLTVVNTLAPVFLVVLLGAYARARRWVDEDDAMHINRAAFNLFAPAMCFYNLYHSEVSLRENAATLGYCLAGLAVSWTVGVLLVRRFRIEERVRAIMLLSFYHSNFLMLIYPIATNLYGGGTLGKVSVLTGVLVAFFNLFSVFSVEVFREGRVRPGPLLHGVVTNPIILACAAALLLGRLGVTLPPFLDSAVSMMASAASPLMLFLLGCFFTSDNLLRYKRELVLSVVIRLLLFPLIFVGGAAALGFRTTDLLLILTVFAAPSGVLVFSLAANREDTRLASNIVIVSTALSALTLSLWLAVLLRLGSL